MRHVLFPRGDLVGRVVCAACHRKKRVTVLAVTTTDSGETLLFLPDEHSGTLLLRKAFGRSKRGRMKSDGSYLPGWLEIPVRDIRAGTSEASLCPFHGPRDVSVANVLAAVGTPDTPRVSPA